jgi:pimeloyl-ACP methyl ester carboxylesterase
VSVGGTVWLAAAMAAPCAPQGDRASEGGRDQVPVRDLREGMDPISAALLFPKAGEIDDEAHRDLPRVAVEFENATGAMLRGLWFDRAEPPGAPDRTVLVCGGNTGNATYFLPFAELLHAGGFDVLLFDYQGFGRSDGVAALASLPGDVAAAWRWLTESQGRSPSRIGVLGISLGSVLALQLAADVQPAACAVEDLFFPDEQLDRAVGAPDSAAARLALSAVRGFLMPLVDPRRNAARYSGPLFLLHGAEDWLLTPMATVRLLEERRERTRGWILAGAGHSPDSLQVEEWEYREQLTRFFADAFHVAAGGDSDATAPAAWAEPRASFSVESAAPIRIVVEMTAPVRSAVQVALVRPREGAAALEAHFERREVPAGTSRFECAPPFVPGHVVATVMHCVELRGDGTFDPVLSPVSRSLREHAELLADWIERPMDVTLATRRAAPPSGGTAPDSTIESELSGESRWSWLAPRLPDFEDVDPRVRPRYAEWLAWLAFDLEASERHGSVHALREVRQTLVDFVPADPARFVTLGNARIDVGFRSPMVVRQLTGLWADQVARRDFPGARLTWQLLRRFEPDLDGATAEPAPPRPRVGR